MIRCTDTKVNRTFHSAVCLYWQSGRLTPLGQSDWLTVSIWLPASLANLLPACPSNVSLTSVCLHVSLPFCRWNLIFCLISYIGYASRVINLISPTGQFTSRMYFFFGLFFSIVTETMAGCLPKWQGWQASSQSQNLSAFGRWQVLALLTSLSFLLLIQSPPHSYSPSLPLHFFPS